MSKGWVRALAYALGAALIVWGAFAAGVSHEERVYCGPGGLDDNDCIFGFIAGYIWAAVALGISVVCIGLIEVIIRRASRSRSVR